MRSKPVQCRCGQVVFVPQGSVTVRCAACGSEVRTGAARRPEQEAEKSKLHARPATSQPNDADDEDASGEYRLLPESTARGDAAAGEMAHSKPSTWTPIRGKEPSKDATQLKRKARHAPRLTDDLLARVHRPSELPGPFFTVAAFFYPLLHPTWVRLVGLSLVAMLAVAMVSGTLFVMWLVIRFSLVASIFATSTMAFGCVGLVSYLVACFATVIEETASGEDRLDRLADFSWWEMLPRAMQTLGALAGACGVAYLVTYPMRMWHAWDDPSVLVVQALVVYCVFPILLVVNLAHGSWLPLFWLLSVLRTVARRVGYFGAFLVVVAPFTFGLGWATMLLAEWNGLVAVAAAGPILAMWLMVYGHWLGRLVRQLPAE